MVLGFKNSVNEFNDGEISRVNEDFSKYLNSFKTFLNSLDVGSAPGSNRKFRLWLRNNYSKLRIILEYFSFNYIKKDDRVNHILAIGKKVFNISLDKSSTNAFLESVDYLLELTSDPNFINDYIETVSLLDHLNRVISPYFAKFDINQSEIKPNKSKPSVEQYIHCYLAYQDCDNFSKKKRNILYKQTLELENAHKYANVIRSVESEQALHRLSLKLREVALDVLDILGIEVSPFTRSYSWAMWDIAKQIYYSKHPNETDLKKYRVGNPLYDIEVRKDILFRHIGWEVYNHRNSTDVIFKNLSNENLSNIIALLNIGPKEENQTLSSYHLTALGKLVFESLQNNGNSKVDIAVKGLFEEMIEIDPDMKELKNLWESLYPQFKKIFIHLGLEFREDAGGIKAFEFVTDSGDSLSILNFDFTKSNLKDALRYILTNLEMGLRENEPWRESVFIKNAILKNQNLLVNMDKTTKFKESLSGSSKNLKELNKIVEEFAIILSRLNTIKDFDEEIFTKLFAKVDLLLRGNYVKYIDQNKHKIFLDYLQNIESLALNMNKKKDFKNFKNLRALLRIFLEQFSKE